MVLVSVQSK